MPGAVASQSLVADEDLTSSRGTWADRLGMNARLRWGYVGLLLFMIGDGVESGFLSP
jgi:hypothetical protein